MKTYTIFSKKLALALREKGHKIIETGINKNYPQFDTYIFEDSAQLQKDITSLTNKE